LIIADPVLAVIFDLDGTLMDTACEIDAALARTFGELAVPALPTADVVALIGRGIRSLVERALQKQGAHAIDVDEAVERFEHHYSQLVATQADLYPGALEGMRLLSAHGRKLAVVTNKSRFFTERLLEKAGVDSMIDAVVAGDDGIRRKPAGDMLEAACRQMGATPRETLMLGDSDNDVLAARAAGCPVWCVPYGYNEGRAPETLACDRLVATVEEAALLVVGAVTMDARTAGRKST
jgi:phosphoglycolate phosphatase